MHDHLDLVKCCASTIRNDDFLPKKVTVKVTAV